MPQIGLPELLILLLIVVFVFGVGKLPEVGRALGRGIHDFRANVSEAGAAGDPTGVAGQNKPVSG